MFFFVNTVLKEESTNMEDGTAVKDFKFSLFKKDILVCILHRVRYI